MHHEHEECARHLHDEERQHDPHQPARDQADTDDDLEHPEHRDDDIRIEPIDRLRDELRDGRDVEDLQEAEPDEDDAERDPEQWDADTSEERPEPLVEMLRTLADLGTRWAHASMVRRGGGNVSILHHIALVPGETRCHGPGMGLMNRWRLKRMRQARDGLTSARDDGKGFSVLAFTARDMNQDLVLLIGLMWIPLIVLVSVVLLSSDSGFVLFFVSFLAVLWLGSFLTTLIVTRNPCVVTIDDDHVSIATMSRLTLRPRKAVLNEPRGGQRLELGRRLLSAVTFVLTSSSGKRLLLLTGGRNVDMLRWSAAMLEGLVSGELAEENFLSARPAPGAERDRLAAWRLIGTIVGGLLTGVGLALVALGMNLSRFSSLGTAVFFVLAATSLLMAFGALHLGSGRVKSRSGAVRATALLLVVSALVCVATVTGVFALTGRPRTEPLPAVALEDGQLYVLAAPCNGDELKSLSIVPTETVGTAGERTASLWRVLVLTAPDDYHILAVDSAPGSDYDIEVAPSDQFQANDDLSLVVETTADDSSMAFRIADLHAGEFLTPYGNFPPGYLIEGIQASVGSGRGCRWP